MNELLNQISNRCPGFPIRSAQLLGEGWRSIAILVNEEWVFRFPKKKVGADDLRKEINLLPLLKDRVTLSIPHFAFVGEQRNGMPFVGYRMLQGEIVGEKGILSLPQHVQETVAGQIADFIREISLFPVEEAIKNGVARIDLFRMFSDMYDKAVQAVFPRIETALQRYVASRFENYLTEPAYFRYEPTLIHGDLSPDHFLIDPSSGKLTGIIDFGDAAVSDPDYEYRYLLEDGGEQFAQQVMRWRDRSEVDAALTKISYFVTFDHIGYILEGIAREDHTWVKEGITEISKEMNSATL